MPSTPQFACLTHLLVVGDAAFSRTYIGGHFEIICHPPVIISANLLAIELKPSERIVEFAAAGPKNYGYRTHDGKVECNVRGFTQTYNGRQKC